MSPQPGQRSCTDEVYRNSGNLPLIRLILADAKPGRALDCGCGAGDNARLLQEAGWAVTGVTISKGERDAALVYCDDVVVGDLEHGIPAGVQGTFELVVLSHVLEHLVDPGKVLADSLAHLTGDGTLAVALPNVLFFKNRFQFLRGRFRYESAGLMDSTHVRFYTFETGADLLRKAGYQIVHAGTEGAFPLWPLRRILARSLVEAVDRAACRLWPGLFGYQLLYIAQKATSGS